MTDEMQSLGSSSTDDRIIQLIRHGQSLHNVDRNYAHRDPPLTKLGELQAKGVRIPAIPDLIIISPMTRTIQTALLAFSDLIACATPAVPVQIWPDMREAHDAICNKGVSRAEIAARYPQFDFTECSEEWDYPPHTVEGAEARAERVRSRLLNLAGIFKNIALVTHRGFIAFLVRGERFDVCETRAFRFASEGELEGNRYGVNVDTGKQQDFGPSLLLQNDHGADEPHGASISEIRPAETKS